MASENNLTQRKIIIYKLSHDTGFAPNVDGPELTLGACCQRMKPFINIGDIIIGIGSQALDNNIKDYYKNKTLHRLNTVLTLDKIIWTGEVTNKMTFREYNKFITDNSISTTYKQKIPTSRNNYRGDCCYYYINNKTIEMLPNLHIDGQVKSKHGIIDQTLSDVICKDITQSVIFCNKYSYFGNFYQCCDEAQLFNYEFNKSFDEISSECDNNGFSIVDYTSQVENILDLQMKGTPLLPYNLKYMNTDKRYFFDINMGYTYINNSV